MENRFFIKFLTQRRKVAECAEGVGVQSWSQGKERSL